MLQSRKKVLLALSTAALAATSPAAEKGGLAKLPPAPQVIFQIGERRVTTFALQRNVELSLRRELARRDEISKAGRWGEAEEARLSKLYARRAAELKGMLVGQALVEELAREAGYRPNEALVEHRLRLEIRKAGGVEALLRQEGRTLDEIREHLRASDIRRRFQARYVQETLGPGPREIREYYAANRERLKASSRVKVRVILISREPDEKAALEKAGTLRRELQFAPGRFGERAREHSAHKQTAKLGGLIILPGKAEEPEWIAVEALAKLNPAVAHVASGLKPGGVSGVVKLKDGFLLVKLDGSRPGRSLSLGEAAERIAGALKRSREDALLNEWIGYYLGRAYFVDGRGQKVDIGGQ